MEVLNTHIRDLLNEWYYKYNRKGFIDSDPVCIPHLFSKKEDIEIAGFLAATLAWGNRKSIITNATRLMDYMDRQPHDFVLHFKKKDLKPFEGFVHRTFNGKDAVFFMQALQLLYTKHGGLENAFAGNFEGDDFSLKHRIVQFRHLFLSAAHLPRSEKHLSDPSSNSSAKRLCMYLRWMVRKDAKGVDFGIWQKIRASELCLPLDVHTGFVSRNLGLLQRKQNDWKAVEEITTVLRSLDPLDPIKYDFALFGLGLEKALK